MVDRIRIKLRICSITITSQATKIGPSEYENELESTRDRTEMPSHTTEKQSLGRAPNASLA
jgi:hypothetical protein